MPQDVTGGGQIVVAEVPVMPSPVPPSTETAPTSGPVVAAYSDTQRERREPIGSLEPVRSRRISARRRWWLAADVPRRFRAGPDAQAVALPPSADTCSGHTPAQRAKNELIERSWLVDIPQGDQEAGPCHHQACGRHHDGQKEAGMHVTQ